MTCSAPRVTLRPGRCSESSDWVYSSTRADATSTRFIARIDEPDKNWKFGIADIEERKFWTKYMDAFEKCLSVTSTDTSPWYVVPADDKEDPWPVVSQNILDTLSGLELLGIRNQLAKPEDPPANP